MYKILYISDTLTPVTTSHQTTYRIKPYIIVTPLNNIKRYRFKMQNQTGTFFLQSIFISNWTKHTKEQVCRNTGEYGLQRQL